MAEKNPQSEGQLVPVGPLAPGQRWSLARKREVALRLLRGEPIGALSRELGVEVCRLERWKEKALAVLDAGLKEREGDPLQSQLDAALRRVGELSMENELLCERIERPGPLAARRSRR
jgi:transposase-like protein